MWMCSRWNRCGWSQPGQHKWLRPWESLLNPTRSDAPIWRSVTIEVVPQPFKLQPIRRGDGGALGVARGGICAGTRLESRSGRRGDEFQRIGRTGIQAFAEHQAAFGKAIRVLNACDAHNDRSVPAEWLIDIMKSVRSVPEYRLLSQ